MKKRTFKKPIENSIKVVAYDSESASTKMIVVGLTKRTLRRLFPIPVGLVDGKAGPYYFELSAKPITKEEYYKIDISDCEIIRIK